jgi:dipeptidyl-peptidase III
MRAGLLVIRSDPRRDRFGAPEGQTGPPGLRAVTLTPTLRCDSSFRTFLHPTRSFNRKAYLMTRSFRLILGLAMIMALDGCAPPKPKQDFKFIVDQFADIRVMRYQIPGFENLSLRQKQLVYFLSKAAVAGRDITFDQNGKYNLAIRKTVDAVVRSYKGDTTTADYRNFLTYAKQVWFSNGIYHHYGNHKFVPGFSESYFRALVAASDPALLPTRTGKDAADLLALICPVMFDPSILPMKVSQDPTTDLIQHSAANFYEGVTEKEVKAFYEHMKNPADLEPPSYGLNSRLVKENGRLVEKTWKADGLYGPAIREIVSWLGRAAEVAENERQKQTIETLIAYYTTGDLKTFDAYNILWLKDTASTVDFVNGFIETYDDPLGIRATWESIVNFKDVAATKRAETITGSAQWFEDHSPVDPRFKKKEVKGVSAKVITIAQLGGASYPSTPIGINLPNADWIRKTYGSKSVTLDNITYAYDQAALGNGFLEEFYSSADDIALIKKYGYAVDNLHTDLHECVGHASGQLLPGVSTDALKNYHAPLEEARADLFALYYLMDPKLVELGLLPSTEAAKAEYIRQMTNGLFTQLVRIQPGKNIEEAHLRNRQLIARWCYEKGKDANVIERITSGGKTYFRINDFARLRTLVGELLKEIQRIKSEGDYEAGKNLVETYGVKVDAELHREALERYTRLKLAPYGGFMNPVLTPVEAEGKITDIRVSYPDNYTEQMLEYGRNASFLPAWE